MISFIVPTLNEASVIERLLKSLQTYSGKCEIIVSDGKSEDRTVEIARKYTDHVLLATDRDKQSISINRNKGAANAVGEFLVFLDADIIVENPDAFFKEALNFFEKNPRLVGLSCPVRIMPELETATDRFIMFVVNLIFRVQNNILHVGAASGEFQMVRNSAFKKVGGYDENLAVAEDIEFFQRVAKIGTTLCVKSLLLWNTGRRPHKLGWPRLIYYWIINFFYMTFLKRSAHKEWQPIR